MVIPNQESKFVWPGNEAKFDQLYCFLETVWFPLTYVLFPLLFALMYSGKQLNSEFLTGILAKNFGYVGFQS